MTWSPGNAGNGCNPKIVDRHSDLFSQYATVGKFWRTNWVRISPLFSYPPQIRKVIYTTNAIESINMSLRKVTKNRGSFPNDEPMIKLMYLALQNIV